MEIDDAPPERMPEIMDRLKRLGKILKTTTKVPSVTSAPEKGMSCPLVFCLTGNGVEESSQVSMYSVMKAIKDSIQSPDDISFSFRSFPYYLSERLQHLLMCTATVYFRHQSFVSCVHNIDSLNRRILLTGPGGTSRCMAAVVASVAKDAGAHLMTFDWDLVTAEGEDDNEEDGGNGGGDEILDEFDFFEEFERRFANTGEVTPFSHRLPNSHASVFHTESQCGIRESAKIDKKRPRQSVASAHRARKADGVEEGANFLDAEIIPQRRSGRVHGQLIKR